MSSNVAVARYFCITKETSTFYRHTVTLRIKQSVYSHLHAITPGESLDSFQLLQKSVGGKKSAINNLHDKSILWLIAYLKVWVPRFDARINTTFKPKVTSLATKAMNNINSNKYPSSDIWKKNTLQRGKTVFMIVNLFTTGWELPWILNRGGKKWASQTHTQKMSGTWRITVSCKINCGKTGNQLLVEKYQGYIFFLLYKSMSKP